MDQQGEYDTPTHHSLPLENGGARAVSSSLPPRPTPLDPLPRERYDLRSLRAIRQIIRSVGFYSRKLATGYGITAPQLICLQKIVENGSLSLKSLAKEVYLSPSTVVGIIDRLEARGLVRRERSTGDRRLVLISVTDAGKQLTVDAPSPLQDALAKSLQGLSELERAAIALSLERIVELMDIQAMDAAPILEANPVLDENQPKVETQEHR